MASRQPPRPIEKSVDHPRGGERSSRSVAIDAAAAALAAEQHGVVSRRQLIELGLTPRQVERRLERGALHPLHRGVYAVGHGAIGAAGRRWAAVLTAGPEAVLSHRSAARLWQILPPGDELPELTRPGARSRRDGILVHQGALPADEIAVVEGIAVTTPPRTVLDCAAVLRRRQLERLISELEVRQLRDRLSVPDLLARHPGRRGTEALRAVLAAGEVAFTRSELEERFLALLDGNGLPRPLLNAPLSLRGAHFEADCLWPEARLLAELDGAAVHGTARAFQADRRRDRVLLAAGYRTVRVTWGQLRDEPVAVLADLRRLLS